LSELAQAARIGTCIEAWFYADGKEAPPRIPGLPGIEAIITGLSYPLLSPSLHDFLLFMKLPGDNYRQYKSKIVNPLADYPVKPNYK